jgi:hypothetical protein
MSFSVYLHIDLCMYMLTSFYICLFEPNSECRFFKGHRALKIVDMEANFAWAFLILFCVLGMRYWVLRTDKCV